MRQNYLYKVLEMPLQTTQRSKNFVEMVNQQNLQSFELCRELCRGGIANRIKEYTLISTKSTKSYLEGKNRELDIIRVLPKFSKLPNFA